MAKGDSIIRVSIIGDASGLNKTLGQVDGKLGGLAKIGGAIGGAFLGFQAIDKSFEFLQGSLSKADDFADAFDNLAGTLTPEFANTVKNIAFDFTNIGLSADEVGALSSNFANLATTAGASQSEIARLTPDMLNIAAAIAATTGKTVDEVIDDIGKAAQGNQKPVREYGIVVDKALNPNALLLSILDQAKAKFPEVSAATSDYAGKQEALNAKWDNFSIKVGEALEGPLSGVLDFFITMIDRDIPRTMDELGDLGDAFVSFGKTALAPLGNVNDALGGIGDAINNLNKGIGAVGDFIFGTSEQDVVNALRRNQSRNGIG